MVDHYPLFEHAKMLIMIIIMCVKKYKKYYSSSFGASIEASAPAPTLLHYTTLLLLCFVQMRRWLPRSSMVSSNVLEYLSVNYVLSCPTFPGATGRVMVLSLAGSTIPRRDVSHTRFRHVITMSMVCHSASSVFAKCEVDRQTYQVPLYPYYFNKHNSWLVIFAVFGD